MVRYLKKLLANKSIIVDIAYLFSVALYKRLVLSPIARRDDLSRNKLVEFEIAFYSCVLTFLHKTFKYDYLQSITLGSGQGVDT
jgi:hypothetical protein